MILVILKKIKYLKLKNLGCIIMQLMAIYHNILKTGS